MPTMNTDLGGPAGYGENAFTSTTKVIGNNVDGSVEVDVTAVFGPGGLSFYGVSYTEIYINSNGMITFGSADASYNSGGFSNITTPALVPFFSDMDLNAGGEIYWDIDTVTGRITITWDGVQPFGGGTANDFQVVITDLGGGDFSAEYIYENIAWTGSGATAVAGYTNGGSSDIALDGSGNATELASYETNDFGGGDPVGTFLFVPPDGLVSGTAGDDTLAPGFTDPDGEAITAQFDVINGGAGNDDIDGGAGNDTLLGGAGNDTLRSGDNDGGVIPWVDVADGVNAAGSPGSDYFRWLAPNSANSLVRLNISTVAADGDGVADYILVATTANTGLLTIGDFDMGTDRIVLQEAYTGITSTVFSPSAINYTITYASGNQQSFDIFHTGAVVADGLIFTTTEPPAIDNDILSGGDDADTFLITDGFGSDTITGGEGGTDNDRLDASGVTSVVTITFTGDEAGTLTDGTDTLVFSEIEQLILAAQDDSVDGSALTGGIELEGLAGNDTLTGGAGADTLVGGDGDDSLLGGAGADLLKSGQGTDTLVGGDGNDTLINSAGDDSLIGGSGDDLLVASAGNDTLDGGAGFDTLMGGTDNDSLVGGADDDLLLGDLAGIAFNDTGTDGVGLATNITDFPATAITYELTFASTDTVGDTSLGSYAVTGEDNEFSLQLQAGTLAIYVGGAFTNTGIPAATFLDGNTNTLAVTWASATGALDVYINGTGAYSGTTATGTTLDTGGTFALGQDQDTVGGGFDTPQAFEGTIYGVRLYNDIRTPGEILDSARGPVADTSDPNLIANWVPDPDSNTISDRTGSHAMTLSGDTSPAWSEGNDTLRGGSGADTLFGGGGADTIDGNAGDDSLDGGADNDLVYGGDGADVLTGGGGNDTLSGGGNPATSTGGTETASLTYGVFYLGNAPEMDTVDGDAVNETPGLILGTYGSAGNELYNEIQTAVATDPDGNTRINIGDVETAETITINGNAKEIDVGAVYNATVNFTDATSGTFSAVVIQTTDGDIYLLPEVSANADHLLLTSKPIESVSLDSVDVGYTNISAIRMDGDYALPGDTDLSADTIDGEAGNDSITGGAGDDSLSGGEGDDNLTGGDGNDMFAFLVGDGNDTITDFNAGTTGTISDGDNTNNDFIDLGAFYDNLSELYADQADDGVLNHSNATDSKGRAVDYSDNSQLGAGDSLTFQSASADNSSFTAENTGVVCFGAGTLILTPDGDVPVEQLERGDLVVTRDNGPQSVLMVACRHLGPAELVAVPKNRPIQIKAGAVGNTADLILSPQHGVVVKGTCPGEERLIRATHLVRTMTKGVRVMEGCRRVSYYHLVFERHEIVFSNGLASESFFPGPFALASVTPAARRELCEFFPELAEVSASRNGNPLPWDCARQYVAAKALPRGFDAGDFLMAS